MTVMRIARIAIAASVLAGCSLLYNPNNLPGPLVPAADAREPDAPPIDVTALKVEAASPVMLLEGQGDGGSRPAFLVVTGENIGPDATIALLAPSGVNPAPMVQVDNAHAVRAASGHMLAVPVTLLVDTGRASGTATLTVQLTQTTPTGPLAAMASNTVTLQYLPELTAPITNPAQLAAMYSRVKMAAVLSFTAAPNAPVARIRAVASIEVGGVHADAGNQTPGTGGAAGGNKMVMGNGAGGGQPGNLVDLSHLTLIISAGGGGYRATGGVGSAGLGATGAAGGNITGDDFASSFATNQSSGGGGGGANPGGGGGGSIELTAGGTLQVGAVSANGGTGGAGSALEGAGGGGSGGTIVLRSGALATVAMVSVSGGSGGGGGAPAAGTGSEGRVRYDMPALAPGAMFPAAARRGAMFAPNNPVATGDPQPALTLVGAPGSDAFKLFVFDGANATTLSSTVVFGTAMAVIRPQLSPGYNRVCVTTPQGSVSASEAMNCIEIGYAR